MKAFHNDLKIKAKYLARVAAHREADQLIKGIYWENGRGCGVGCTIHSADHSLYQTELGIPEWLARVEDTIFEGLPNEQALAWPEQFLSAIRPGADLEKVNAPFMIYLMERVLKNFDNEKYPEVTKVIKEVSRLYKESGTSAEFKAVQEEAAAQEEAVAESAEWMAAQEAWATRTARWAVRAAEEAVAATWEAAAQATWAATQSAEAWAMKAWATAAERACIEISDELLKIISSIEP